MHRLLIVGPVAAGKTALADAVSCRTGIPRTELDNVKFGPLWQQIPEAEFRARVKEIAAAPTWIIDGNYASVRDVLWGNADTVAWLDYPLHVVLRRLVWRTLRRVVSHEDLGGGRRESVRRLVGRQSILLWAIRSHRPLRAEYERASRIYGSSVELVRLRSAVDAKEWLLTVPKRLKFGSNPG
jgi:adenylate kinase family enzyme